MKYQETASFLLMITVCILQRGNADVLSGAGAIGGAISIKMNFDIDRPRVECARGWIKYDDYCYKYVDGLPNNTLYTWTEARTNCQKHGADLVSIHSQEENQFVSALAFQTNCSNLWIGLQYSDNITRWRWSDGSALDFTYINPAYAGTPRALPVTFVTHSYCFDVSLPDWSETYGYLTMEKKTRAFVCKKAVPSNATSVSASVLTGTGSINGAINVKMNLKVKNDNKPDCESGWSRFGESCYKFFDGSSNTHYTWPQSRNNCIALDANLVSIHSKEENDFVSALAKQTVCSSVWIGLQFDRERTSNFLWSDLSTIDFSNIHPDFESTHNSNGLEYFIYPDCHNATWRGKWGNQLIYIKEKLNSYLCEKPVLPPTKIPPSCGSCAPFLESRCSQPKVLTDANGCKSLSCKADEVMYKVGWEPPSNGHKVRDVQCASSGVWNVTYSGSNESLPFDGFRNQLCCT